MRIGIVIPTKGERPEFLKHCIDMMQRQTIEPSFIRVVSEDSGIEGCDITWRYRNGLDTIFNNYYCDVCFLIEEDDYYSNDYLETMLSNWIEAGKPDLFGIATSTYYHIGINKYKNLIHNSRSSAYCTMVTNKVMELPFCKDNEPFFDMHLWKQNIHKATFIPTKQIALGIKHGVGSCGGKGHLESFPYDKDDKDLNYLKSIVDKKSLEFYEKF